MLVALVCCARVEAAQQTATAPAQIQTDPFTRFSHEKHVAENLIGCGTCHPYARHGPVAGLVAASTCVACHKFVGKDKPEQQAVVKAFADEKTLAFERVWRQPDHVYFSHERHLARGLLCAECHGDVAHMGQARRVRDMSMGFCLDCHRERQASVDCLACHK
jgi:hypothetical protein